MTTSKISPEVMDVLVHGTPAQYLDRCCKQLGFTKVGNVWFTNVKTYRKMVPIHKRIINRLKGRR